MIARYSLVFTPQAERQLVSIFRYVENAASAAVARRFTDAIVAHCEGLHTFPRRGSARDDLRPGLRITGFRRRVTIAFSVEQESVSILGIFYAGQNYDDRALWQQDD